MVTRGRAETTAPPRGAEPVRAGRMQDLVDVLAVLTAPRSAYRRLVERRPLLVPWLLVALPSMGISLLVISVAQRAAVHLLADLPDPELAHAVSRQLAGLKVLAVAAAPAALWIRWSATAALLWAAGVFAFRDVGFRAVLSIVACAGIPDVIGKGLDLAVVWQEGPELGSDLVPRMSSAAALGWLLPAGAPAWLAALAEQITPFRIWSGVLWTVGLAAAGRVRWRRAAAVTVPAWMLLTLAAAAFAAWRSSLTGDVGGGFRG